MYIKELSDEEFDDMLYELMPRIREELLWRMALDEEPARHVSLLFRIKMWLMIKQNSGGATRIPSPTRTRPVRVRFVIVAIVTAVMLTVTAFAAIPQLRSAAWHVYQRYTEVFFDTSESEAHAEAPFVLYAPTYIPAGFTQTENFIGEGTKSLFIVYRNNKQDKIIFNQGGLEGLSVALNTEGVELVETEINGTKAYYYSNIGMQSVFWYDDNYSYLVSSNLDKNTVIKIAESVEVHE